MFFFENFITVAFIDFTIASYLYFIPRNISSPKLYPGPKFAIIFLFLFYIYHEKFYITLKI